MEPSNTPPKLQLVKDAPATSAEAPAATSAEVQSRAGNRLARAKDSAQLLAFMLAGGAAAEVVLEVARALGVLP